MNKVIVTGATSYIGIALIDLLVSSKDVEVCAIVRPKSERTSMISVSDRVKVIEAGLDSLDIIELPEDQYSTLYHIGWDSNFQGGRDNYEGQSRNLKYCLNAVELAHKYGCSVFVGIGSQAECGRTIEKINSCTTDNPENAYGIIKCKAYQLTLELCEKYGIKQCWPRLLSAYGLYERPHTLVSSCINACMQRKCIDLTACEQIWDYINTEDVAKALLAIANKGRHGVRYAVASGIGMPLREYIRIIAEAGDFPSLMDGIGKRSYSDRQVMYLCGDITELQKDTGFIPSVHFKQGIMEIFARAMEK